MLKSALFGVLLLLAACAGNQQAAVSTLGAQAASPQPAAASLSDGLAVQYYRASFDSVRDLESWMTYRSGKPGAPLDKLSYDVGAGDVLTSDASDLVGAHITGFLLLDKPGTYRFQVTNNDGVRMHLGGARIHDDPKTGPARTSEPIAVEITDPGYYPVEIWYFEKGGTSVLEVQWRPPGSPGMSQIPLAAMKH